MTRISEKLPDTGQKVLPSIQALSDD